MVPTSSGVPTYWQKKSAKSDVNVPKFLSPTCSLPGAPATVHVKHVTPPGLPIERPTAMQDQACTPGNDASKCMGALSVESNKEADHRMSSMPHYAACSTRESNLPKPMSIESITTQFIVQAQQSHCHPRIMRSTARKLRNNGHRNANTPKPLRTKSATTHFIGRLTGRSQRRGHCRAHILLSTACELRNNGPTGI